MPLPAPFFLSQYSTGTGSSERHRYQVATERQGRQRSPSRRMVDSATLRPRKYVTRMPFCSPRSSRGYTSGRSRLKMRNISAVQRPMPRTSTSSAMISSSLICGQRCMWIEPFAKCCARSAMYSVLRSESPQARSTGLSFSRTFSGVTGPTQAAKRSHTLCAAFTEICWPTLARARVRKGSPRRTRKIFGCVRMMPPMTGSRRASERFAESQYSGFMQRKIQKQVLGLHAHYAILGGEREIHLAPRHVGAHHGRVLELQREERKDVAHAAGIDLVAGPQLVQDRARFRVEADVPRPARLLDLADRLHTHFHCKEVLDPPFDHARKGIQGRPPVGEADDRVVPRFALPIEAGVRTIEHVEIGAAELALRLDDEAPDAAVALPRSVHLHRFEVGEKHVAVLDRRLLLPVEELAGAQPKRVLGAVQHVSEDDVRELVDEHRRHVDRALEERHVGALHRASLEQAAKPAQQDPVVVADILVFQSFSSASGTRRRGSAIREACSARSAGPDSSTGWISGRSR